MLSTLDIMVKYAVFIGIALLGIGGIYLLSTRSKVPRVEEQAVSPSVTARPTDQVFLPTENELIINDEESTGASIRLTTVKVATPAFVVVKKASDSGSMVLGYSKLLPAGQSTNVIIPLSEKTRPGIKYEMILYPDEGDGIYKVSDTDSPLKNSDGSTAMISTVLEEED